MNDRACEQCPWRRSNHGRRHKRGFYTKKNARRLWKQIRNGGVAQSCHLTDPSHPDHVEAGANENAKPQECPGSIILINREFAQMADESGEITTELIDAYRKKRRKGLTKSGLFYWVVTRLQMGGVPFFGGPKLPKVPDDPEVGLPDFLAEG